MIEQPVGAIRSQTLPEMLFLFHQKEETGRLTLRRGTIEKRLYLQDGVVAFASSTDRDDRLIQSLLRRGKLPLPRLLKGLEVSLRSQRRLGEVLVEQGLLSQDDLARAVQEQIRDIVFGAFQWTEGRWQFEAGARSGPEDVTLRSHPLELILEGIRRVESWARVQEILGGLNTEYRATKRVSTLAQQANVAQDERQVVTYCEETRTLEEICEAVPLPDFAICKLVWGLLVIGALMKA